MTTFSDLLPTVPPQAGQLAAVSTPITPSTEYPAGYKTEVIDVGDLSQKIGSYAELRALTGGASEAYVMGRENVFDGAHGYFVVDTADTTSADNDGTILVDAAGRRWKRQFSGAANTRWFGAVGDGVTDDTVAIQAAIDFAAPYEWQGSVSATNASQQVRCALFTPVGKHRITGPLLLSKGLCWLGETAPGFFQTENTSMFLVDFDAIDGFILDTAPYNTSGVRVPGATYSGAQFDGGLVSTTNSILLERLFFSVAPGRKILGGMNMTVSAQSHVRKCGFFGVNVGIRTTCSWAGSFKDNYIFAKAQGLYFNQDVTAWDVEDNYITVTNSPDVGYVWPCGAGGGFEPWTPIANNYACILAKFSSPNIGKNTLEGGNIGIAVENGLSINPYSNYMEGIKQWCYVISTTNANIVGGYTLCSGAKLLWTTGSERQSTVLDYSGVNQLLVSQDAFSINYVENVTFKAGSAINLLFNSRVNIITPEHEKGTNTVWLSSSGNDANNGLNPANAVLTLQEALVRVRPGLRNEIVIPAGEAITTKYSVNGTTATFYVVPATDLTIRSTGSGADRGVINVGSDFNECHALQMAGGSLRLSEVVLNIPSVSDGNYRSFIRTNGTLSISAANCGISGAGSNSAIFGAQFGFSSIFNINTVSCTFNSVHFIKEATGFGGASTVAWIENNSGSTFTSVTTDASLKILSKQFP